MGLDGISVNQLRVTPEQNSNELNNVQRFNLENPKIVDGLSQGQRVDPDRQNEHDKTDLKKQFKNKNDDNEEESFEEGANDEVFKYDLSKHDKYILKVDDESDNILIVEKATNKVLQEVNAENLAEFVKYMAYSQGSIINRKY